MTSSTGERGLELPRGRWLRFTSRARAWLPRVLPALACVVVATALPRSAEAQSVRVTTDMGAFTIELDPERAPLTVKNFLRYVNEGFYTNTLFHRVVAGFVVQGGGHSSIDMKLKPTHEPVFNESGNGLQNKRGTVGMARSASPHSGNAQFYINVADNPELDPLPTRWGYAVFGHVTEGMDVVDRMAVVATGAMGPFKSEAPLTPIVIRKVEVIKAGDVSSALPKTVNPAVMPSTEGTPAQPAGAPPSATPPNGSAPSGAPSGASSSPGSDSSATGAPPPH